MVTRPDSQEADSQHAGDAGAGVHAIVLAAGAGTRMGGEKLRRLWRGRPLLTWSLEAALCAPVERVWLITGADPGLGDLAPPDPRLRVVRADDWKTGLSASIRAGVAALPGSARGALVFLGDMPRIPPSVAGSLVQAWRGGAAAAAPKWAAERGHPVLLDRSLFAVLASLSGDRGAGALLAGLGERLALVDAPDDGVLFDVDAPSMLDS